jgi:hypothetical protein
MADDDTNLVDDFEDVKEEDPSQEGPDFYSDDVEADAIAEEGGDPDKLVEHPDEDEVTSGDERIGDLDDDAEEGQGSEDSYDEEDVPAGDNVVDNLP